AEDGIRAFHVTGVQTCALPILLLEQLRAAVKRRLVADVPVGALLSGGVDSSLIVGLMAEAGVRDLHTYNVGFADVGGEKGNEFRSEERRVGKECRAQRST